MRTKALAAVAAALLFTTAIAHAEPTPQEKETARALMDQGDEKFEEKNYDAALKAYVGAHAIMRVPTTALEVAKAHEKLGHLVEARDALLEAHRFPKAANEPAAFTTARVDAERHAQELGERIPSLLVKIEGAVSGYDLHLTIDKVALPPAAAQLPIKLNPGHHVVLVSSDATYDASAEADLVEKQAASVTIKLSPKPLSERNKAGSSKTLRTVGLITGGLGVVGVGIGAFFGLQASSKQDDANCPDNRCKDESSAEMLRDANSAATISNIGFIAGGVLVAAGVTMFVLGGSSSHEKTPSTARVHILPTGLAGTF
jgi:hypothetical protein